MSHVNPEVPAPGGAAGAAEALAGPERAVPSLPRRRGVLRRGSSSESGDERRQPGRPLTAGGAAAGSELRTRRGGSRGLAVRRREGRRHLGVEPPGGGTGGDSVPACRRQRRAGGPGGSSSGRAPACGVWAGHPRLVHPPSHEDGGARRPGSPEASPYLPGGQLHQRGSGPTPQLILVVPRRDS